MKESQSGAEDYFTTPIEEYDYYDILGITKDAKVADIRSAYTTLSRKYHPDKNTNRQEQATEIFKKISDAYNVLSDEEKKSAYDLQLKSDQVGKAENTLNPEKKEKFEKLSRDILEIINPSKKDIPISLNNDVSFSGLQIGKPNRGVTTQNLSSWERDHFVTAVDFISNRLLIETRGGNDFSLGNGAKQIDPRPGETTRGGYTRLRYSFESIDNLYSLLDRKDDRVSELLKQYEEALNFTIFFNRTKPKDSLLEASIESYGSNGEIMVKFNKNILKDFENEDQKKEFQEQLSKQKKQFSVDADGHSKSEASNEVEYIVNYEIIKSKVQEEDKDKIDSVIKEHKKDSLIRYKILTLNGYISSNNAEGVRTSIEELKNIGIILSKLEEITTKLDEPFPLFHAVKKGANLDIVRLLVENDFNLRYEDKNMNGTAGIFYSACKYCKSDVVKYVYEQLGNPDPNKIKGYFGETPLHGAIRKIEPTVPFDNTSPDGKSYKGEIGKDDQLEKLAIVEFLIKNVASFDVVDDKNKTPMEYAKDFIKKDLEKLQKEQNENNLKKFPSKQAPDAFLALDKEMQQDILEGTSISITQEELYHAKRFLALVAITGGQNCTKVDGSKVSQKDVYLQQGILPNSPLKATGNSIDEQINSILPEITNDNIKKFYARLIEKRPKTFYYHNDEFLLQNNDRGNGCPGDKDPESYVLYSEMEFGAMLQVSGLTQFINKGDRYNAGNPTENDHETQGRISAIAGARLELDDKRQHLHCMEAMHCIKGVLESAESQHKDAIDTGVQYQDFGRIKSVSSEFVKGYKYIWSKFYEGLKDKDKDNKSCDPVYESVLEQRLYISYKKLFADAVANSSKDRKAYIRVIGLGDGAWSGDNCSDVEKAIGKSVRRVCNELSPEQIEKIAAIEFSQYKHEQYLKAFNQNEKLGDSWNGVDIISSTNAPFADKLGDKYKDTGCQLFVNFAWDGGSYVGNEYWVNNLVASGDPAAACCSSIVISMNHEYNKAFLDRLNIVTREGKVETLESFAELDAHQDSESSKVEDLKKEETGQKITAPFLVESYQAASNYYTSEGALSIASPIYKMQDDSEVGRIFPYGQKIRGDGGCYLNAALVGILNRCVNDQEKWQQFKKNVKDNYDFAEEIIEKIETEAALMNTDGTANGLDRKKLNEILQKKGDDNLARQLSKEIITSRHNVWIQEYNTKINELIERDKTASAQETNQYYIDLFTQYRGFLEQPRNSGLAYQYEEAVLQNITKKLIDKTGITDISTIGKEMKSAINENRILAKDLGLCDNSTIYLSNTEEGNHFNLYYGINDPIIQELEEENKKETRKREDKKVSDEKERQKLLQNIDTIKTQQEQQEGKAPNEKEKIATIKDIIDDILKETDLNDATLPQLSLINDIYEATKTSPEREAAKQQTRTRTITRTKGSKGDKTDVSNTQEVIEGYNKLCFQLAIIEIMTLEEPAEFFSEYLKVLTPNNTIESKRSLAHIAAMKGKSSFINSLLIDLPNSFRAKEEYTDNTPLMWAIANANNGFAFDLLKQVNDNKNFIPFIDIDHISLKFSNTALHLAVAKGYKDMDSNSKLTIRSNSELVSQLIKCGSNPNILTDTGLSALDIAVMRGDIEMVQSILTSPKITAQTIDNAYNIANQQMSANDINNKLTSVCGGEAGRVFKAVTQDDIKTDKINRIQAALQQKLNEKFPQFKKEQEYKRRADIIIVKQAQIYSGFFDQNGVIKPDKKENLKVHKGAGIDWWAFPGFTSDETDTEKNTATKEVYDILSKNPSYCQKYKTFIYQYIAAFDDETNITHEIRFNKLVESLTQMTANNTRTLAGFTQKEQDLLFIAVKNFKDRIDYKCTDDNYNTYFNDLSKIADESKEVSHNIWLVDARVKLRERLKLPEGAKDSNQIQARPPDYQPVFANGDILNQLQIEDFNKRFKPYDADNNNIGCGTLQREVSGQSVEYPFVHFRLTHDPISKRDQDQKYKLTRISDKEYLQYPPVAAICIHYPDYRNQDKLPDPQVLKSTYKQKTLETLVLYNELKVDHLVKHGDGMGVFLKQIQRGGVVQRSSGDINNAMSAYLDGFFEAVAEFYNQNPSATLKKITCPILDDDLEKLFKEKLANFKIINPDIGNKITPDKAGPRFNITKYYTQGAKKLGMTIAPHKNHEFLGGVLDTGNVLEEQMALTDIASIGNHKFNKNVQQIVTRTKSHITSTDHTPQTPSPTVAIKSDYKKENYVTTDVATGGRTFCHNNGHNNGNRLNYSENIPINEDQRKAGAYHHSNKKTHEVLNDILQSVIDAAQSTGINDILTLKTILIEATMKATVKDNPIADPNVKKFSALFQEHCKNKNIFSAQDHKTGLRTKRFGDVFGGIEGIESAIDIHIIAKDSELSLNKITEQVSAFQTDKGPRART